MNIYDEKYDIRLATYEEIPEVMEFIDTYWKKGHILGRDRAFFEYEHCRGEQVNFVIAKSKEDGLIKGVEGVLYANNEPNPDIWGSLWKVKRGEMPFLGVEFSSHRNQSLHPRYVLGTGANALARKITTLFGGKVAKMEHYYMYSEYVPQKIACIKNKIQSENVLKNIGLYIVNLSDSPEEIKKFPFEEYKHCIPYKDDWYVRHRFYENPYYKYEIYGLSREEGIYEALLIARCQENNGSSALRIVDFYGKRELLGFCYDFFMEKLKIHEYIDFYTYGFEEEYIQSAGFLKLQDNDENIIPDYFNPFEQRNVDIWCDVPYPNVLYFKADGDQDRPC